MTICPSTDIHRTTNLVRRVARGLGDDADLRGQTQEIESFCRVRFFQLKRTRETCPSTRF
jgi:hypothetical protein